MQTLYINGWSLVSSIIVILCWITWGAWWIIAARNSKQKAEEQDAKSRREYSILMTISFILLIADTSNVPFLNINIVPNALAPVGAFMCVLGLAFTLWARRTLAGNWSGEVAFKKEHELIEKGPYAIIRHPIYTGLTVMFIGTAIVVGMMAQLLGFVIALVSFRIKLRQEEELLVRHFPKEYPDYKKRTNALIPYIW